MIAAGTPRYGSVKIAEPNLRERTEMLAFCYGRLLVGLLNMVGRVAGRGVFEFLSS